MNLARASLVFALLAGLGCSNSGANTSATTPSGPRPLAVMAVQDLGTVAHPPSVLVRDGGASGKVGGRVLWTFGDTLFTPSAVDGATSRSNTAALADFAQPLAAGEPVDARGAPSPLLPFTAEEQAYNAASGRPDERYALWPGSVVEDGAGGGLVYYLKLKVHPGFLNYEFLGTGVARVPAGSTTATREPGLLFPTPGPIFDNAFALDAFIYAYGALPGSTDQSVGVARVPLDQARDRAAYRFWDGSAWGSDPALARAVMRSIPGALTVSKNAWLGQYLAVHSLPFSNKVVLRVAAHPEGPWSDPVEALTGASPVNGTDYAGREHPELAQAGGQKIYLTYFNPTGTFRGELRMAEVTLK